MRAQRLIQLVAAAAFPLCTAEAAHAGLLDGLLQPKLMRRNPGIPPPMDDPQVTGVDYRADELGRLTYLSLSCLSVAIDYTTECVVRERAQHALRLQTLKQDRQAYDEQVTLRFRASQDEWARSQARKQAEEKAQTDERAARAALPIVEQRARDVHSLKRSLAGMQRMLDTEKEISAVSGATNLQMRYNYGMMIVSYRRQIANAYAAYRRAGGRKPLSTL